MSTQRPLISVIIPCFNADKYLHEALESILTQTYTNLEIILINDGSTDKTRQICQTYLKNDRRILYIENKVNLGLIYTLNIAISKASGEFIARMDADDLSEKNRIQIQLSYLLEHPEVDILGSKSNHLIDKVGFVNNINPIYLEYNTLKISSLFSQPLIHGSVLAKTNLLKKNPYNPEYKHSEDFELWLRLLDQGAVIANINDQLYSYRINNSGVSFSNTHKQIESHIKASHLYLEKKLNRKIPIAIVEILNNTPSKELKVNSLNESILLFNSMFSNDQSSEIMTFRSRHLFNIHIQMMKVNKSKWYSLIKILASLIKQPNSIKEIIYFFQRLLYRASLIPKK